MSSSVKLKNSESSKKPCPISFDTLWHTVRPVLECPSTDLVVESSEEIPQCNILLVILHRHHGQEVTLEVALHQSLLGLGIQLCVEVEVVVVVRWCLIHSGNSPFTSQPPTPRWFEYIRGNTDLAVMMSQLMVSHAPAPALNAHVNFQRRTQNAYSDGIQIHSQW